MLGKLSRSKEAALFEADIRSADLAFRESVLLMKLLEAARSTAAAKSTLVSASAKWRQSPDPGLRTTGISLLRFLFKAMNVAYSQSLIDEVLNLFASSTSLATRLSALDTLGAMSATPNPTQLLQPKELERLIAFRAQMMQQVNTSQREYATTGVAADVARELSMTDAFSALVAAVERIGRLGSAHQLTVEDPCRVVARDESEPSVD